MKCQCCAKARKQLGKEPVVQAGGTVVVAGFIRHYWSEGHRPYQGCIHDADDKDIDIAGRLHAALSAIPEGNDVEIVVRTLGTKSDKPHWALLKPHEYGPADDLEQCLTENYRR